MRHFLSKGMAWLKNLFLRLYHRIKGRQLHGTGEQESQHVPEENVWPVPAFFNGCQCKRLARLAVKAEGKPILFYAKYEPAKQVYPGGIYFSHVQLFSRKKREMEEILEPMVLMKWSRKDAAYLPQNSTGQKHFHIFIVGYPVAFEYGGRRCGTIEPAYDFVSQPFTLAGTMELHERTLLYKRCYHPVGRPHLNPSAGTGKPKHNGVRGALSTYRTPEEKKVATLQKKIREQQSPEQFRKNYLRTQLLDIAEAANGRPVILYGDMTGVGKRQDMRICFRHIRLYSPDWPYGAIEDITDHLMVESTDRKAYGRLMRKSQVYGKCMALIGYLQPYERDGFKRCGFKLAKNIGVTPIMYWKSGDRIAIPRDIQDKCYLPDMTLYIGGR